MTRYEYKLNPALDVATTLAKAQRLADRATKKGLSGGYTVTTETRQETTEQGVFEATYLVVEGSPAKYNGYTFVASVEWVNGSPVVTGSPYYEGEPVDRSALVKGACDHCGVNRTRRSVVVVETESGERKQVGKSCVKDYLGNSLAVSWFAPADPFEEFDGYGGYGTPLESTLYILTVAASVVRQRGWVSRGNAEYLGKTATADLVALYNDPAPRSDHDVALQRELRNGFDAEVDGAAALAALEFGKALEPTSDWAQNLQAVIASEWFNPKYTALVVSLAGVYAKSLQKQALEAEPVVEEPYGKVGDKVTLTLKVVSSSAFDTQYGLTYANTFTADGHRFKWLTRYGFEPGETVTLKGTIKKFDEWNDKVFTVLTRCKEVAA